MTQRSLAGFGVAFVLIATWPCAALAEPTRPPAATSSTTAASKIQNAPADAFKPQESSDVEPAFGPDSLARTLGALKFYEEIVAQGGWRALAEGARGLKQGASGPFAQALKERLAISGDLDNASAISDLFDAATAAALKRFQARHGLSETGAVGRLTFAALNVTAEIRLKQLRATVERLQNNVFKFDKRYVVVNIPGAVVEAVNNGKVERRHLAVVGKRERQSPVISARISSVNLNPHWTVPNSIIKNDVAKALKADVGYLNKNNLRTLNHQGEEVDPNSVNWRFKGNPNFLLRQDPGPQNALGQLKIDMPNVEAVYMHDTPKKELFKQDVRFHSSGCARVSDVRDLAAWLLAEQGVSREEIDRGIDAGSREEIKLKKQVPVAWVYLTAYGDGQGRVQFREDIYGLDTPEGVALTTLDGKKRARLKIEPQIMAAKPRPARLVQRQSPIDPIMTGTAQPKRPSAPPPLVDTPMPPRLVPMAQR